MERIYGVIRRIMIIAVVFLVVSGNEFVVQAKNTNNSVWDKVAEISVGDGRNEIAYVLPEREGFNRGPEAIRITSAGEIAILDSINNRVLYVKENKIVKTVNLEKCLYPLDFCLSDAEIYVLDESDKVLLYDNMGNLLESYSLPDTVQATLIRELWIDAGKVGVTTIENVSYQLSGKQLLSVRCPVVISEGTTTTIVKETLKWKLDGTNKGIDYVGTDQEGNLYVHEQEYVPDVKVLVLEDAIVKYDKSGNKISYSIYNVDDSIIYPSHDITVTESGEVYAMKCKENRVEIYRILLGTGDESHIPELTEQALKQEIVLLGSESDIGQLEIQATNPNISLTRSKVLSRAQSMENLSWIVSSENKTERNPAILPSYVQNASIGSTVKGIPYCWGGFNGFDTVSRPSFSAIVGTNVMAGNVRVRDANGNKAEVVANTVGLDCSGFVSSAYGLTSKMGTSGLAGFGYTINEGNLKSMDFLVKSGSHVVLYESVSGSNYIIYDSSTDKGKVERRMVSKSTFSASNGYVARTPWLINCEYGGYQSDRDNHWRTCKDCGYKEISVHTWVVV